MSAFETAVVDSKKLTSKPDNKDLLELYGLYKIATGEDITKATVPGFYELKAKAKYNSWSFIANQEIDGKKINVEQAQEKYVTLVERLKEELGYDADKVPEAVGSS